MAAEEFRFITGDEKQRFNDFLQRLQVEGAISEPTVRVTREVVSGADAETIADQLGTDAATVARELEKALLHATSRWSPGRIESARSAIMGLKLLLRMRFQPWVRMTIDLPTPEAQPAHTAETELPQRADDEVLWSAVEHEWSQVTEAIGSIEESLKHMISDLEAPARGT